MRIPAAARLDALPLVFSLEEAREAMDDLEESTIRLTLSRWKKDGNISPIGPKAGVYFNIFKDPEANITYLAEGILKCHDPVCVRGVSALYEHKAIAERPPFWTLAIRHTTNNYRQLYDAEMSLRPIKFFELLTERGFITPHTCGLPVLSLEATLADMQVYDEDALKEIGPLKRKINSKRLDEVTELITFVAQRGRKPAEYISAEPSF